MGMWSGLRLVQRGTIDMRANSLVELYIEDLDQKPKKKLFEFSTYDANDARRLEAALREMVRQLNQQRTAVDGQDRA